MNADGIYTRCDDQQFYFKAKCRASMAKREVHDLTVSLDILTGDVKAACCTCKAGKSSYCIHIMALLSKLQTILCMKWMLYQKKNHVLVGQETGVYQGKRTSRRSQ